MQKTMKNTDKKFLRGGTCDAYNVSKINNTGRMPWGAEAGQEGQGSLELM